METCIRTAGSPRRVWRMWVSSRIRRFQSCKKTFYAENVKICHVYPGSLPASVVSVWLSVKRTHRRYDRTTYDHIIESVSARGERCVNRRSIAKCVSTRACYSWFRVATGCATWLLVVRHGSDRPRSSIVIALRHAPVWPVYYDRVVAQGNFVLRRLRAMSRATVASEL